ncbi:hypothetical protein Q3C01_05160 [Bradyrhizobium sp. UFLA05-109]
MITEILAQIRAPSFTAGIVLFDDKVIETAPILRYMRNWSRDRVRAECQQRGWTVSVVHQMERDDVTAPPMPKVGIVQQRALRPFALTGRSSSSISMRTQGGGRSTAGCFQRHSEFRSFWCNTFPAAEGATLPQCSVAGPT